MTTPNIWSPENSSTVIRAVIEAMKGTSVTSNAISAGNLTFVTQPDKFFNVGSWLLIVYVPNTYNWITGQVVSYDSVTGVLVINAQFGQYTTTAPLANWQITVSGSQAAATWTGGVVSGASTFNALATFNNGIVANSITLAAAPVASTDVVNKAYADSLSVIPVGSIMAFPRSTAITGWLDCNGQAVDRITYAALFAYIDTVYGAGDGITTFNVPNLSRRVIVGSGGTATGVLGNNVSATGGAETHTLTIAETPAHAHTYESTTYVGSVQTSASWINSVGDRNQRVTSSQGGNQAHNNIQPSIVFSYKIKA